jgi:hypothetical protein
MASPLFLSVEDVIEIQYVQFSNWQVITSWLWVEKFATLRPEKRGKRLQNTNLTSDN